MKKLILAICLLLAVGVIWASPSDVSSFGFMLKSTSNFTNTCAAGGDGYYSHMIVYDNKSVNYYFVKMVNNRIIWTYAEIGPIQNFSDLGNKNFKYTINGNVYLQSFYTGSDGHDYMKIEPLSISNDLIFYFD